MNPENTKASPKLNSALQALALSNIEEGMGYNVTRAQGYKKNLPRGDPHSFEILQRLRLLRVKKNCWLR